MADEFAQSLTLLFSGASITLLSTVAVDALRGRREKAREAERAKALEREKFRELGREHTMRIHETLVELISYGIAHKTQAQIDSDDVEDEMVLLRSQYLLVPDAEVRASLAHGMFLLVNSTSQSISQADWTEAAAAASFVVAAYLRGDPLPMLYTNRLADLEAKYQAIRKV
jgi:hypothetical protein